METLRASGVQTGGPDGYRSAIGNSLPPSWRSGCWRLSVAGLNPAIVIAAKIIVAKAGVEVVVPVLSARN